MNFSWRAEPTGGAADCQPMYGSRRGGGPAQGPWLLRLAVLTKDGPTGQGEPANQNGSETVYTCEGAGL